MNDDLDPVRGCLFGLAISLVLWIVLGLTVLAVLAVT